jgi:hypothetical protein
MATNTYNNIVDIVPRAMNCIENNLTLTKHVNRGYDDRFRETGGKIGDTANIRIPGFYTVNSGSVAVPQGYNDTYVPVVLQQFNVPLQFTSKELRLNIDEFEENVLAPMIVPAANYIDQLGFNLCSQFNQVALNATLGNLPVDLSSILTAGAILDEAGVPRADNQRAAILTPRSQSSIINGLKTLYNPISDISRQYKEGNMGQLAAGMKFSMDQNAPTFTTGAMTSGTPLYASGATDAGAGGVGNTIVGSGFGGTVALVIGDVFTINGVYSVNPVSKASTGQLKQFTLTIANTTASTPTLTFSPPMYATGPLQNVSALPVASAPINFWGLTGTYALTATNLPTNFVFHRDALLLACADLPSVGDPAMCRRIRSKKLNLAIRLVKWYNGTTDVELYRLDFLIGWAMLRQSFGCRVHG